MIVRWWHCQHDTSSHRTPLARMLPRVIGSPGGDRGRLVMPARIPRRRVCRKAAEPAAASLTQSWSRWTLARGSPAGELKAAGLSTQGPARKRMLTGSAARRGAEIRTRVTWTFGLPACTVSGKWWSAIKPRIGNRRATAHHGCNGQLGRRPGKRWWTQRVITHACNLG
jgi:hypothetical protein